MELSGFLLNTSWRKSTFDVNVRDATGLSEERTDKQDVAVKRESGSNPFRWTAALLYLAPPATMSSAS